jgi:beta-phosphoglucomutase-like phosphatase (HAD superfamily)
MAEKTMAERLRGAADTEEREFAKAKERGQTFTEEEEREHVEGVADLREAAKLQEALGDLPICTCTDHSCESCREWFGMDPWPHLK